MGKVFIACNGTTSSLNQKLSFWGLCACWDVVVGVICVRRGSFVSFGDVKCQGVINKAVVVLFSSIFYWVDQFELPP